MKKSGIELHSIITDASSACLAYELDKDHSHTETYAKLLNKYLFWKKNEVFFLSNVLVYRLGGSTYECSIIRMVNGCFQTIGSVNGFDLSGELFTDILTDLIAEEFQK